MNQTLQAPDRKFPDLNKKDEALIPISPVVRNSPVAKSIVNEACTAAKGLAMACALSWAVAMAPNEVRADTMKDIEGILSLKSSEYGKVSGWVDVQSIKVAGGANFELPVKPEVKELWDFFAKNKREKDIDTYNSLLPDHRKKVVEYFQAGKKEQKDERALLKGVVNYMSLSISLEKAYQGISEYAKTNQLPKELTTTFTDSMERALAAFPGATNFIDKNAVIEIEAQTKAIYQEHINEMNAKITDANAKITDANAKITDANAKITDANAKITDANAKIEQNRKKSLEILEKLKKL